MFHSFFPDPRRFLFSALIWAAISIGLWHGVFSDWEDPIGIASATGWDPARVWLYQYNFLAYALFAIGWMTQTNHPWAKWSVGGSAVIVFTTWFQVQLDVWINEWFRTFFDLI